MRKHMANYRGVKLYEVTCYKIWHITMLTAQLYLKSSLFHKMKCPSWTRVKRQKRSNGRTENGKGAKNTHFRESFVRQESCRPVTTFELEVIQWIYLLQKSTVVNAITCNEIKTSFPIRKQIYGFLLLFVKFLKLFYVSRVRVANSDIPSASVFKTTR